MRSPPDSETVPNPLFSPTFRQPPPDGRTAFADIAALLTVRGRRAENQDRAFASLIDRGNGSAAFVACVLDGMGGMRSGGEAAALAAATFLHALSQPSGESLAHWLVSALTAANAAVWDHLGGNGGAMLTAIAIDDRRQVLCVHVGDSRLYARGESIDQVTADDTVAGLLGADDSDFISSGLMQFVGMGEGMLHQSFDLSSRLPATLLLATDGFHSLSSVPRAEMFDPSEAAFERLAAGLPDDNATAVIVDVAQAINAAANHAEGSIRTTSTGGPA